LEETPLIHLYVNPDINSPSNANVLEWKNIEVHKETLRPVEKEIVSFSGDEDGEMYLAVYDMRSLVKLQA